jgi:hypothetical protein
MADIARKVFAVPASFRAVGRFLWLIGQSDDPYRLIYYTKQGDVERAFETIDMPNEEIQAIIGEIRDDAETVAEEVPEIRDIDRDELPKP